MLIYFKHNHVQYVAGEHAFREQNETDRAVSDIEVLKAGKLEQVIDMLATTVDLTQSATKT